MRKLFKTLGIIATLAVLLLSFAGCDGLDLGGSTGSTTGSNTGGGTDTYKPVVYTSFDPEGTMYELTITRTGRAVKEFTPATGDSYTLDITTTAGVTQTSTGQITVDETTYMLKHTGTGETFSVTVSADGAIVSVTGDIPIDNSPLPVSAPIMLAPAVTPNKTPVASDYDIGNLTQTEGSVTAVTITPKAGKSSGKITIYYTGFYVTGPGGLSDVHQRTTTTPPTTAGSYSVTFSVAAALGWNPATGLSAGTLKINPASSTNQTPVAGDYDIANLAQTEGSVTAVTITPKAGKSSGAVTIKYAGSTTIPQTAGTYAVTFDVAEATGWNAATGLSAGTLAITSSGGGGNPPTSWTAVDVSSIFGNDRSESYIRTIAYGGGKFVAIGWQGMAYSSDGVSWTDSNSYRGFFAIAYGGGKFVSGGMGYMVYSNDGISWSNPTERTFRTEIYAIAYGNGKFVAGSAWGEMAYSPDGVNWTVIPAGTGPGTTTFDTTSYVNAIAYGNGKFVAGSDDGKMAYSSDGISWTAVTDSTFSGSDTIWAIAHGNGKFVAGDSYGKMAYSSDGINWTAISRGTGAGQSTFSSFITAITYGNGYFVATGYKGQMAYSSDGINWTAIPAGTGAGKSTFGYSDRILAIAFDGSKFVAGGDRGQMAYSN